MGNSGVVEATVATVWDVPTGKSNSAMTKLWRDLDKGGARVIEQLDTDDAFRQRAARFMLAGGYTSANEQMARLLLGDDLITPAEVIAKRQPVPREGQEIEPLIYTAEQLEFIYTTVPPLEVLVWYRDHNYGLVPLPPRKLNLLAIRDLKPIVFCTSEGGWYAGDEQEFSRNEVVEITDTGWLAIRKDAVPKSTRKAYEQQCGLLLPEEHVPQAVQVAWFDTLFAEVRDVRLHQDVWVRTSSVTANGRRVCVRYNSDGFNVSYSSDDVIDSNLGVSASR